MRSSRNSFRFPVYTFQTKKRYSIIFTRSQDLVYTNFADGQTDGRTDIFQKSFLTDQEYIYMSIPISITFQISLIFWPKLVYLFFHIGNRYKHFAVMLFATDLVGKELTIQFKFIDKF